MQRNKGFRSLVDLEVAKKLVLKRLRKLPPEEVSLREAMGRVLYSDVVSPIDVPPFDRAAMDGYAARAKDTVGASETAPVVLKITRKKRIGRNLVAKISTGEPMPKGADCVIPIEKARVEDGRVLVLEALPRWKNVSRRGEDVSAGEKILEAGRRLGPREVGILATCGIGKVRVVRKPKVLIVPTGEEIVDVGKHLERGKVYDCNTYFIASAVEQDGGVPVTTGPVKDDLHEIMSVFESSMDCDMMVFTGGSSVGERDLVPLAVEEAGELIFHGVAIRPGSPTSFGVVDGVPVFSLPGFPAGCFTAFDLLVRPAIRFMLGVNQSEGTIRAKLSRTVPSMLGRTDVLRVKLLRRKKEMWACPIRISGSGVFSSIVKADGYVLIPPEVEKIEGGTEVEVHLYT